MSSIWLKTFKQLTQKYIEHSSESFLADYPHVYSGEILRTMCFRVHGKNRLTTCAYPLKNNKDNGFAGNIVPINWTKQSGHQLHKVHCATLARNSSKYKFKPCSLYLAVNTTRGNYRCCSWWANIRLLSQYENCLLSMKEQRIKFLDQFLRSAPCVRFH